VAFGLCHCLGVFGEAVSSHANSLKSEEHCLTQGGQAVAHQSPIVELFSLRATPLRIS